MVLVREELFDGRGGQGGLNCLDLRLTEFAYDFQSLEDVSSKVHSYALDVVDPLLPPPNVDVGVPVEEEEGQEDEIGLLFFTRARCREP